MRASTPGIRSSTQMDLHTAIEAWTTIPMAIPRTVQSIIHNIDTARRIADTQKRQARPQQDYEAVGSLGSALEQDEHELAIDSQKLKAAALRMNESLKAWTGDLTAKLAVLEEATETFFQYNPPTAQPAHHAYALADQYKCWRLAILNFIVEAGRHENLTDSEEVDMDTLRQLAAEYYVMHSIANAHYALQHAGGGTRNPSPDEAIELKKATTELHAEMRGAYHRCTPEHGIETDPLFPDPTDYETEKSKAIEAAVWKVLIENKPMDEPAQLAEQGLKELKCFPETLSYHTRVESDKTIRPNMRWVMTARRGPHNANPGPTDPGAEQCMPSMCRVS